MEFLKTQLRQVTSRQVAWFGCLYLSSLAIFLLACFSLRALLRLIVM
jgi:hypothetical protein